MPCYPRYVRLGFPSITLFLALTAAENVLASSATPTFTADIAPLLAKHCLPCHFPAGIASVASFTSYVAVRPWAKAIKEKVTLREMPPWPADPARSLKFRNDARLTNADINTLIKWIDAGVPEGSGVASLTPAPNNNDWAHPQGRKPDLVISMERDLQLPASGEIPYLRFLVKVPLTADRWVSACQARPGNASVVHHMAITEVALDNGVTPSDIEAFTILARQMGLTGGAPGIRPAVKSLANQNVVDMLAIYTPGATLEAYPDDTAKLLRGASNDYINFNIHYTPNGKPSTDRSQVAFWFRDTPPKHQLYRVPASAGTIIANGKELLSDLPGTKAEGTNTVIPPIPAGDANYELIGITAFTQPVTIYQLHPHAHFRGKDFTYVAIFPDGRELALLIVPKYDFRWQLAYELETPLKLPAGSKLVVTAHYDNSPNNKFNPDAAKEVFFRDQNQSTDEMFSPFVQYSVDTEHPASQSPPPTGLPLVETIGCLTPGPDHGSWRLLEATVPTSVASQAANSDSLQRASQAKPGVEEFQLVGLSPFNASQHKGETAAVRGVLLPGSGNRLNVTSLQSVASFCAN